jgi:glucose-1-phosphate thymidylyltransferase
MKIVIPMAGFGTRLRPHTWSKPKPLVSVAGKPVLGHVMDMFESLPSIDEVIFIVGYLGEQVDDYVSEAYPHLKTRYVVQEEMKGQSHAIWLAREGLTGPMLMVFVDTLIETDLSGLENETADAVGWVKEVPDPRRFGVVELGPEGDVTRLIEKPDDVANNLAVVGFYYFKKAEDLIAAIEEQIKRDNQLKGEYFLADAINVLLENDMKMRIERVDVWEDCGKPDALLQTNRYLLDHGRDNSNAAAGPALIIVPPVFIDPSAEVTHSVIGPHVSIGPGCKIENSVIKNSVLERGTRIANSLLSDSLIGRDAVVKGEFHSLNIGDTSEVGLS